MEGVVEDNGRSLDIRHQEDNKKPNRNRDRNPIAQGKMRRKKVIRTKRKQIGRLP